MTDHAKISEEPATKVRRELGARVDRVVVFAVSGGDVGGIGSSGRIPDVETILLPMVKRACESGAFGGNRASSRLLFHPSPERVSSLWLVGLGDAGALTPVVLRDTVARLARRAREERCAGVSIPLDVESLSELASAVGWSAVAEAIVDGWRYGSYWCTAYRSEPNTPPPARLTLVSGDVGRGRGAATRERDVRDGARRGEAIGSGVNLARALGDAPASELSPQELARRARAFGRRSGCRVEVFGPAELRRRRMGAILAVGQGSVRPPRLIIVRYAPKRKARTRIALVGKAITFDSGGLSLKPARGMEEMKFDMCGGAAVLGALEAIARLRPAVEVIGVIPAAENMVGGSAMRPGDVVRSASGKTIEVNNTDAEGRLVLADGLWLAQKYAPEAIVDIATLTGACAVALGTKLSGLFANDDALAERIFAAGEATGDRVWRLPLYEHHVQEMRGKYADLRNSSSRYAAASTAAAFLSQFAGDGPWCHLDIAGTAWSDRDRPQARIGATGVGVRLLVRLVEETEKG